MTLPSISSWTQASSFTIALIFNWQPINLGSRFSFFSFRFAAELPFDVCYSLTCNSPLTFSLNILRETNHRLTRVDPRALHLFTFLLVVLVGWTDRWGTLSLFFCWFCAVAVARSWDPLPPTSCSKYRAKLTFFFNSSSSSAGYGAAIGQWDAGWRFGRKTGGSVKKGRCQCQDRL